MYSIGTNMFIW